MNERSRGGNAYAKLKKNLTDEEAFEMSAEGTGCTWLKTNRW